MRAKDLRAVYDLHDYVTDKLGYQQNRQRMYKCWLHADNDASVKIYAETYTCFGCNAQGDILDFMCWMSGLSAGEVLAQHDNVSDEELKKFRRESQERRIAELEQRVSQVEEELRELREKRTWEAWHEEMTDTDRKIWEYRGVDDWYQKFMYLGAPSLEFYGKEGKFKAKTLSIPVYGDARELQSVKFRLLDTTGSGKYRILPNHASPDLFFANPEATRRGTVILVEGEIKAMVTYLRVQAKDLCVAGMPSKFPTDAHVEQLGGFERVVYIPDPDCTSDDKNRVWKSLKEKDFYVFEPVMKIDDLLIEMNATPGDVRQMINNARLVRKGSR